MEILNKFEKFCNENQINMDDFYKLLYEPQKVENIDLIQKSEFKFNFLKSSLSEFLKSEGQIIDDEHLHFLMILIKYS